ncbi:unnamed protein product [Cylicocyclus nassatus]|uniref:Uncharacterized protein n=1 Tax=Cylicocyclus nassatus TaxID=53992 RepID=A0AA36GM19_CYLNA|nr:unnamed protein product [Cylicocyclus nassatus]
MDVYVIPVTFQVDGCSSHHACVNKHQLQLKNRKQRKTIVQQLYNLGKIRRVFVQSCATCICTALRLNAAIVPYIMSKETNAVKEKERKRRVSDELNENDDLSKKGSWAAVMAASANAPKKMEQKKEQPVDDDKDELLRELKRATLYNTVVFGGAKFPLSAIGPAIFVVFCNKIKVDVNASMVRRVEPLKDGSVLVDFVDILDRNSVLVRLREKAQQGVLPPTFFARRHPLWGPEAPDFQEILPFVVETEPGPSRPTAFNDRVNFIQEMFMKGEIDKGTATKFFAAMLRDKE